MQTILNYFVNLILTCFCNFQLYELQNIFEEIIKILSYILGSFFRIYFYTNLSSSV
jgi:hypothetical protein